MLSPSALEMERVSFSYGGEAVLSDVNLIVHQGDFLLLVGGNGSGKTTLVRVALGILENQRGTVRLFGQHHSHPGARRRVAYVPQRSGISSKAPATAIEAVAAGRAVMGCLGLIRREDREAAMGALERVGLAHVARRRVGELSGGEHQRVMIARALVADASLLVLDEPGAGVDRAARHRLAELLGSLHEEGTTIILVAHDVGMMGPHLTRAVVLHEGHLDDIALEVAGC